AADKKSAGEVRVDDATPFLCCEFEHGLAQLDACIVHENIDEHGLGIEAREGGSDLALGGYVESRREDTRTRAPHRFTGIGKAAERRRSSMPLRIIFAPASARPSAMARPRPREDPVMSAVRPLKSKSFVDIRSNLGARGSRGGGVAAERAAQGPRHDVHVARL